MSTPVEEETVAMLSYEQVARRLGRQARVTLDKRRGTEFRIAPRSLALHASADEAEPAPDLEVRYRGTPVVTLHPDHTLTLKTGGLATKTVLRRISEYSPISLVVRGGTVYVHRLDGTLAQFYDGMRVDYAGRVVEEPAAAATPQSQAPDLNALISELLAKRLAELGLGPTPPAATAPTVQAIPTVTEPKAPVKAIRMRATLQKAQPENGDHPTDIAELLARTMRAANMPEDQIVRVTKDFNAAFTRGREGKTTSSPATSTTRTLSAPATQRTIACPDCGDKDMNTTHYDKANRFRGCAWAARQKTHPTKPRKKK